MATNPPSANDRIGVFYSHLIAKLRPRSVDILAVAHMVPNTLTFAPALNALGRLVALLPKPKSTKRPEHALLAQSFNLVRLSREWAHSPERVFGLIRESCQPGRPIVVIDIGGYFSSSAGRISELCAESGFTLAGIVEGTENGVQRYEAVFNSAGPIAVPVITTARSPLKLPEDYLIASSIVFSIEAALRRQAEILQTRTAAVIGYGRVGSAVADILRARGVSTVVHDIDPTKLAQAAARGFRAFVDRRPSLESASLVVCATGNRSLDREGFGALRRGCVVASATSAEDEFEMSALENVYVRDDRIGDGTIVRYFENRDGNRARDFLMIADGDAANFLDGAVVGPAIQLIEGEKLAAIAALLDADMVTGPIYSEVGPASRRLVAETWNSHFLGN